MSDSDDKAKNSETSNDIALLPAVSDYLNVLNQQVLPAFIQTGSVPTAINAREALANLTRQLVATFVEMPLVIDDIIESTEPASDAYDVPVRIFCPSAPANSSLAESTIAQAPLPVILYFHGGGGTAGSVSVYHQILCRLAKHTGHVVVAPEYRLAPENPYPCAQNDARTALLGLPTLLARHHMSIANIVVAGDSHGSALLTNLLRDPTVVGSDIIDDVSAQVLIYPSVDFTMSCASMTTYADGYLLSRARVGWYFEQYFQQGEDRQAKSALFASGDELAVQPPALIINAAVDPLYDEGVAYAHRLTEAGISVQHIRYDGVLHAYLNMENLNPDICTQTYKAIAAFLNDKQG